jgi:hypothetical protein
MHKDKVRIDSLKKNYSVVSLLPDMTRGKEKTSFNRFSTSFCPIRLSPILNGFQLLENVGEIFLW